MAALQGVNRSLLPHSALSGWDALGMHSVYVFDVEGADADSWSAEVAVIANKFADANQGVRAAGLHKKQIKNGARPVRIVSLSELPDVEASAGGIVRKRSNDGWTAWTAVPFDTSLSWRVSGDAIIRTRGAVTANRCAPHVR